MLELDITKFIIYLRDKNKSSATISTYLSGVRHFFNINDIELRWKKIHKFEGERERRVEDRPYAHAEIKLLLEHTIILRNRARET